MLMIVRPTLSQKTFRMNKNGNQTIPSQSSNNTITSWTPVNLASIVSDRLVIGASGVFFAKGQIIWTGGGSGTRTVEIMMDNTVIYTESSGSSSFVCTFPVTQINVPTASSGLWCKVSYTGYLGGNPSITSSSYLSIANKPEILL